MSRRGETNPIMTAVARRIHAAAPADRRRRADRI
jgi:hypothetical protein